MSLSRLRSQLEYNSSVSDLNIRLRKTPVLLSDSKARHLRDEVARGVEKDIDKTGSTVGNPLRKV
jgi:hypothetical protein